MNTFNFFNLTNPVITIPITIIMGFGFIVVLFHISLRYLYLFSTLLYTYKSPSEIVNKLGQNKIIKSISGSLK